MTHGCLYRFRIFPDEDQEDGILKNLYACRNLYSYFFKLEKEVHEGSGIWLNMKERLKILKDMLKEEDPFWAKGVDPNILAFTIKYISENGFSRESKDYCKQSYTIANNGNMKVFEDDGFVRLPYLGFVRGKLPNNIEGEILTATIEKDAYDDYYVGIYCQN